MVVMSFNKTFVSAALVYVLAVPATASAHCDTIDGPVVKAAQRALATGNVAAALIWVEPAAEAELRDAFSRTMEVRRLDAAARELADRYFYETLVRLHRAGEGEPFTGIEPAATNVGPVIPAADRAIASGALDPLTRMLTTEINLTLRTHFNKVLAARAAMTEGDVPSGRTYVKAYIEFMHDVERLHEAATSEGYGLHNSDAADRR